MTTLPILLLAIVLATSLLAGWGPGHHLEFAERVRRRRRELLPSSVATLLGEEKEAYQYGNLAADIINFKGYGGVYNHCHRWAIIEDMRALAETPREEAFILGYLSHLAADTIAHNHFVPYHLVRFARLSGLGHLYWEMNADRFIPERRWEIVTMLKSDPDLGELDELVNRTVPKKALSMRTNKMIFNHVLLVSERQRWRAGMARLHPIRQVSLDKGFLARFQRAAVERVRLALHPKGFRRLRELDPNGKAAQKKAALMRRELTETLHPGAQRSREAQAAAVVFLEGMQTPRPLSKKR